LIEYLPEFMAEWGLAEYGFIVSLLALLGVDGRAGWKVTGWIWRLGKEKPNVPQLVVVQKPDPILRPLPEMQKNARGFVGREDALAQLRAHLQGGEKVAITGEKVTISGRAAVQGAGGLGKTTLAKEYVSQHGADYGLTLWVPAIA